jgi:hypothetical protein
MTTERLKVQMPSDGHVSGIAQPGIVPNGMVALDTSRVYPGVDGSIDSVRQEIDDAFADMKTCINIEPDEAMRLCGGQSARLSELRVRIQRIEDFHRQWKAIRTREIEPALDELRNQFVIASRLLASREFDFKVETGGH